jgi:hypothetical protein
MYSSLPAWREEHAKGHCFLPDNIGHNEAGISTGVQKRIPIIRTRYTQTRYVHNPNRFYYENNETNVSASSNRAVKSWILR